MQNKESVGYEKNPLFKKVTFQNESSKIKKIKKKIKRK